MYEITINSSNDASFTLALEPINAQGAPSTIRDAVTAQAVLDFFGFGSADEAVEAFCGISEDSSEVAQVAGAAKRFTLAAAAKNGLALFFDEEVESAPEESSEEEEEAAEAQLTELPAGTPGIVTVFTSGGMQSTNIQIRNLETTLKDAIYNDAVRQRSAMGDAQLSNCVVTVNDNEVCPSAVETYKLSIGDQIVLSPRSAHTKG